MIATFEKPPTNVAGYNPLRDAGDCTWDAEAARRAVEFFPALLSHPDDSASKAAGDPFCLEPWQADYVATLYGWKRPNKQRRYKESLYATPRKNGKSCLLSGLALYGLAGEGKLAAQIYSAAMDREQAGLIYQMAARMVRQQPLLEKRLNTIDSTKRITYRQTGSFYAARSGDSGAAHGTKPYMVLFDELHTQRDRRLYDNLRSGQGASPNSLFLSISTAGWDRDSICFETWRYARAVRDGQKRDPYFLPLIYEIGENEDWTDEKVWARCNPNLGISIELEFLREQFERAQSSPGYENTFKNLYLNQWTEQAVRWLSMRHWDDCGKAELPDLAGVPCWGALDMSSTTDITAFVLVFSLPGGRFAALPHFWIPEETAMRKERVDAVPYREWKQQGFMHFTSGNRIDHQCVFDDIVKICAPHNLQEITVDRNLAEFITQQMVNSGYNITEFPQTITNFSMATKLLETKVLGCELLHGGHPVLRNHASNVTVDTDRNENIRPIKSKSTGRIDGIVALIMAMDRAATCSDETSVYETRGLASIGTDEPRAWWQSEHDDNDD